LQEGISAYVEDFEAKESKYARALEQVPTEGKKIPSDPKMWKCFETAVTENLWMNLSTGFIGSGRKQWDGSGGNGASERHFEATGSKYDPCSVSSDSCAQMRVYARPVCCASQLLVANACPP
jgi:uncharacterized UBP type Zn finger protein